MSQNELSEGEKIQKTAEVAGKYFQTKRRERAEVTMYEIETAMKAIEQFQKLNASGIVYGEDGKVIEPNKIREDAEYSMSMLKSIQTKMREEGPEYVSTIEGRPDWLTEIIHTAHEDMLPDDWKYAFIEEAVNALANTQEPNDVNLEPDIYNHKLLEWLSSNLTRPGYIDDAVQEFGMAEGKQFDAMQLVGQGQWKEKYDVLNLVREGLAQAYDKSLEEAEEIAADKEDYELASGKRDYLGKILGVTDLHVVQSLGKEAVIFHKAELDRIPEVDENITIHYDNGAGQVEPPTPQQSKDLGR